MIVKVDDPRLSPEEQAKAAELAQRRADLAGTMGPVSIEWAVKIVRRAIEETILRRDAVAYARKVTTEAGANLREAALAYAASSTKEAVAGPTKEAVAGPTKEAAAGYFLERAALHFALALENERKVSS